MLRRLRSHRSVTPVGLVPEAHLTGLRSDRHLLTVVHGRDEGELYDLAIDPTQTVNRWADPQFQTVKVQLLKRLCDRMAETIDPLPPTEAAY